jgi:hypothetical protein
MKKYKGIDRRKKRLQGRKVTAYITTNIIYVGMFVALLFKSTEVLKSSMVFLIGAILINAIAFVSINAIEKLASFKLFGKDQ